MEHYSDTIESGVSLSRIKEYLAKDDIGRISRSGEDKPKIWGIVPSLKGKIRKEWKLGAAHNKLFIIHSLLLGNLLFPLLIRSDRGNEIIFVGTMLTMALVLPFWQFACSVAQERSPIPPITALKIILAWRAQC